MSAAAKEIAIVTKDELLALADLERKYSDAKKKASAMEADLKFRRQSLAEKVLGVKSADELKELGPEKVLKLQAKRLEAGDWKPERGAPEFAFSKTSQGRYPSWKDFYVGEFGETAAAQIQAETPITFSYCVEVTPL